LSGAGSSLVKIGGGSLTLTGTGNTYSGPTEVLGGTLVVTSTGGLVTGSNLYVGTSGLFFDLPVPAPSIPASAAVAAVPEPGTLALVAIGTAAGLAAVRRRKRKSMN
jgi:fibronectin-binding autotransporter adhesin